VQLSIYSLMPETALTEDVCITIKHFPFHVLILVNGSSLTSNGSFEVIFPVVLCITLMQIKSTRLSARYLVVLAANLHN